MTNCAVRELGGKPVFHKPESGGANAHIGLALSVVAGESGTCPNV